jgi:hypothetical protein
MIVIGKEFQNVLPAVIVDPFGDGDLFIHTQTICGRALTIPIKDFVRAFNLYEVEYAEEAAIWLEAGGDLVAFPTTRTQ